MEQTDVEKDLSKRLFGKDATTNLKYFTSPFSLIWFCYEAEHGFGGDDFGMFAKACNEFFPTPTYQGICLTRNTDIKEVMKTKEAFDPLFDSELQESIGYVNTGTIETENTLVLLTGGDRSLSMDQTNVRTMNNDKGLQFNVHQSNDFANLFQDNTLFRSNPTLILSAEMEYSIDIVPHVVQTTESFKNMSFSQRKCKLPHEIEDNSIFKFYAMKNCQYECYIKMAEKRCQCIPWDFMHNSQALECDLFGRTCFYNAMKNLIKSNETHCKECIKECDYTTYEAVITKQDKIQKLKITGGSAFGGGPPKCGGQRAICEFLLPNNGTKIIDQGSAYTYNTLCNQETYFNLSRMDMLSDVVIVHLRILKPDVQLIDAKYTILDKFANFGGNFGIFAEITGCSFLGILNFFIILFKFIFSSHQNAN